VSWDVEASTPAWVRGGLLPTFLPLLAAGWPGGGETPLWPFRFVESHPADTLALAVSWGECWNRSPGFSGMMEGLFPDGRTIAVRVTSGALVSLGTTRSHVSREPGLELDVEDLQELPVRPPEEFPWASTQCMVLAHELTEAVAYEDAFRGAASATFEFLDTLFVAAHAMGIQAENDLRAAAGRGEMRRHYCTHHPNRGETVVYLVIGEHTEEFRWGRRSRGRAGGGETVIHHPRRDLCAERGLRLRT